MPGPAENPVAPTTPAESKGMEPENEPRPCHHQLAVHAQEGTQKVRIQQKRNHTVRDLVFGAALLLDNSLFHWIRLGRSFAQYIKMYLLAGNNPTLPLRRKLVP